MRTIVIAGATGVVGRHLRQAALDADWRLRILTRNPRRHRGEEADPDRVEWVGWDPRAAATGDDAAQDRIAAALDGADAVVNLAGETVAAGRLGPTLKRRVLESRVHSTEALILGWLEAEQRPSVWLNASGVSYYGDTGDEEIDETGPKGDLFLSDVCEVWEDKARTLIERAQSADLDPPRLALPRIGLVLADDAPAWERLLVPIRFGAGGRLGSGQQWWPWIDADELASAFLFIIDCEDADGVINLTAPEPARQIEITKGAAERLDRPAFVPAPAFALRLVLGQVADELLLPSCKALPVALRELGYEFQFPNLDDELDKLLSV